MRSLILPAAVAAVLLAVSCAENEPQTLTVISYNVRNANGHDGDNDWELRKSASPAMVKTEAPDIFGVQEAFRSQWEYLLDQCPGYRCVGVGRDDGSLQGETMAIFWNTATVELEDWGTYWLSETPDEPSIGWDAACRRTATWAFMKHIPTGNEFFYVNTHLDHIGVEARRNGLALIESKIAEMNGDRHLPMILTGDLNIPDDDPTILEFDARMQDARKVAAVTDRIGSYHGWGTASRIIDYVYFKGFSSCGSFKTLNDPYAGIPYISDHYPVKAVLAW